MNQKFLSLLSLILAMVTGMGGISAQTITDVTGSTTWNWSLAGIEEVKLTAETTPTKSETFVLSQVIPSTDQFKSDALLISSEYPVRGGKYYQGGYIKFHTTVPGTVKVTFSNTGNRLLDDKTTEDESLRRWLYINGQKTKSGSCVSSTNTTSEAVAVEGGDVEITAYIDGNTSSQYIRVYTVEFEANGTTEEPGDEPGTQPGDDTPSVDPSAAHLLWDYTEKAPSGSPDNGLTYASNVNDSGKNNNLKGIKMNSSGYAYFTKEAVAGTLKLTFGPRSGSNNSSLSVYTYTSEPKAETKIATTKEVNELSTESIDLTAEQNNIYIARESAVEQVLTKIEFVPFVPRTFQDFELDFMNSSALPATPAGVTSLEGSPRGDSHGLDNFKMVVPVDGPVKITLGGCQYSNTEATILNSAGETIGSIDVKTPGCYHNKGIATWIYSGAADVLTIKGAQYTPYIRIEAIEIAPCTVTFKDHEGNVIGKLDTFEGEALGEIPYTAEDLPAMEESAVFRGWFYTSGVKAKATDAINGNTTIWAMVTPYEYVNVGSVQNYNLTSNIFYPEDHETITIEGGYYYDSQHGWALATDGKVSVKVAGKAQVVLSLCKYSKDAAINVTDASGNTVAIIESGMVEDDGKVATVSYTGSATTLTFTFTQGESYLHKVAVYNVEDFVTKDENTGYYIVPSGDAAALILALNSANGEEGAKIFLPDGTYDLGETTSTTISGKNVSIIGESTEGTIIKNAPSVKVEGLGSADLLYNTSTGLYMQDLTLQNDLDYYAAGAAGRAAVLQDNGNQTILRNVAMRSFQDTYYSKSGNYYFEGGLIQGTVDYICGGGNAFFENMTLFNASRSASGQSGDDTMTAYNGTGKYVFNNCSIESRCSTFNFGRSWGEAFVVFLNTTIKSGKLVDSRFSTSDMNSAPRFYGEYNTVDLSGNGKNTPASNHLTTSKGGDFESVLTAEQAKAYSYESLYADGWDPKTVAAQATADAADITADALYLVETDGKFTAILKGADINLDTLAGKTIRKANARGGFGAAVTLDSQVSVDSIATPSVTSTAYDMTGRKVANPVKGMYIVDGKKVMK